MKVNNIFKGFAIATILVTSSPLIITKSHAQTIDQLSRLSATLKDIDLQIQAEQNLYDSIIAYINIYGEATTLLATLNADNSISDSTLTLLGLPLTTTQYKQSIFSANPIIISFNGSSIVVENGFSYLATSSFGIKQKDYYIRKKGLEVPSFTGTDTLNSYWEVLIPEKTKKIIELKEEAETNGQFSFGPNEPEDKTKPWIKTNPDGSYELMVYDEATGTWVSKGTVNEDEETILTFYADDGFDPLTTPGSKGWKAKVEEDEKFVTYTHNGTKWIPDATNMAGEVSSLFNGTGTVTAMATSKFNSAGGSIMETLAPNGEWGGSKTFTKKDDAESGGYWKTDDNAFVVTNTIESLSTFSNLFLTGTTAWVANGSNDVYKLEKRTLPDSAIAWVYIATDYSSLFNFIGAGKDYSNGEYIYVSNHNEYFYYDNTTSVFKPHTSGSGKTFVTNSSSGRNTFSTSTGNIYLSQINDCSDLNCNGAIENSYYAGSTIDNLYAFYYSSTGKNLNSLTDASPYDSWATFWADEASAVQWNGTTFGEVNHGDILVKESLNGSIVYSRNGDYINKNNGFIIPQNVLPAGMDASTANITQYNSLNWINASSLDDFAIDTNLPVDYTIYLSGSGLTKYIKRCNNYDDNMQWSDNCLDIAGSTVAITDGSRSDLVSPSSNSRINLTKQVGDEPNYTTTGVAYSSDTSWKQWFYSATGTTTNLMLDVLYIDDIFGTSSFDDTIVNTYGEDTFNPSSMFIDKNGLIDKLINYNKQCRISRVYDITYNNQSGTVFPNTGCTGDWSGTNYYKTSYNNQITSMWVNPGYSFSNIQVVGISYSSVYYPGVGCRNESGNTYNSNSETSYNITASCGEYGSNTWYQ